MPGTPPITTPLSLPRYDDGDTAAFSAQINAIVDRLAALVGAGNGLAGLDADGNLPDSQLPGDLGVWQDWTPTWGVTGGSLSAQPEVGFKTGRYVVIGKTCSIYGEFLWGSGAVTGPGNLTMSLPVAAATSGPGQQQLSFELSGANSFVGSGTIARGASSAQFDKPASATNNTLVGVGSADISSGLNVLLINGTYETA